MFRRLPLALPLCILSPFAQLASASPALASTVTSSIILNGTALLSSYPCLHAYPPGCPGTFSGSVVGVASGDDLSGHAYVVEWPDPTPGATVVDNTTASINYGDACDIGPDEVSPSGAGGGTITIVGGLLKDNGVTSHGAQLVASYSFGRTTQAITVEFDSVTLWSGTNQVATNVLFGAGVGGWVPLGPLALCTAVQSGEAVEVTGVHATAV